MSFYDLAYWTGLTAAAPYWLIKPAARRKVLGALRQRNGQVASGAVKVWIHAVSVGELNASRELIAGILVKHPGSRVAVSVTTETGYVQAGKLYGGRTDVAILRFPLDFSASVRRVLDALRPSLVILMELEVWPNFMKQCQERHVPVLLLNGRVTPHSYRRYRAARWLTRPMFAALTAACVQEETYAQRFIELGVPPDRILVTGTMKFDTAIIEEVVLGAAEVAERVGLDSTAPIWVCGSTGPGEEQIILAIYARLLHGFGRLRLVIVPRKPERFDEVAGLIEQAGHRCVRRSRGDGSEHIDAVVLGDTMGELRKFYSLASFVFVGRTLVDLGDKQHGSDMIEPAALGKAVVVGPFTANFAEPMNCFVKEKAMEVVKSADELEACFGRWLLDSAAARDMGLRARQVVAANKGATQRHLEEIGRILGGEKGVGFRV